MRRAGLFAVAFVVALAGSVGIVAFFQSRDQADIGGGGGGGSAVEQAPGVPAPGDDDERLQMGNVLLTFRAPADGAALRRLAEDVAGPSSEALVDAGQAVLVERAPDQRAPVIAHAHRRRLEAQNADDPELRQFVEFWLGQAAVE